MKTFVSSQAIPGLSYNRTEYTLLQLPGSSASFVQAAAYFFVESWMSSALPSMLGVWQNWNGALQEDKLDYIQFVETALLSKGRLIDEPEKGFTSPIGAFAETMLRWLRKSFAPNQLLVEPVTPQPTGDGKIDFIEITGFPQDYQSMKVTLWEVKASDNQASGHNPKIYRQLEDYPKRFFPIANCMSASYSGTDPAIKLFLRNMGRMVRNRDPQVNYGVFITYDAKVPQNGNLVPKLHQYPKNHPSVSGVCCHHLGLLLLPDFKNLRLEVWRSLHLV